MEEIADWLSTAAGKCFLDMLGVFGEFETKQPVCDLLARNRCRLKLS
jgi:hypothetical protein